MARPSSHVNHSFFAAIFAVCLSSFLPVGHAQSISTNTPVPPLQWLNITNLLHGSGPPPLKDASIGYDPTSRSLLIFGGESQGGFPQSQTYLLNLNTLIWSTPTPPDGLTNTPPPRSAAIGGSDFAASYRHGHVVIGGKDANGQPLSDVWEFDYVNHFWTQVGIPPGGPSRWSASGGIDVTVAFDPTGSPTPNNTFYLAGGVDTNGPAAVSDTWVMKITGTLSSNLANDVNASWTHQPIGNYPAVAGDGGTVIGQQVVAIGGCENTTTVTASCAQQGSWVFNFDRGSSIAPGPCAAPRIGPAVVANMNGASQNFQNQVFVMLGLFNTSLWQDGGNLQKGEVDVLDLQGGSWARIMPAGDPGSGGNPAFPSPREGAVAVSSGTSLVGPSGGYSDTIVFGGRDASGNYLNELWVLRSYNASVSSSGQHWSGFGNGQLQSGTSASGSGVSVEYLTSCVSAIQQPSGKGSSSSGLPTSTGSSPQPTGSSPPASQFVARYDTSFTHKLLAPLSLALLLPFVVLYRASLPSTSVAQPTDKLIGLRYLAGLGALAAYGLGVGGIATSFTSISRNSPSNLAKRASSSGLILKTSHGQAGIALFVILYGVVPALFLVYMLWQRFFSPHQVNGTMSPGRSRANSSDTAEKLNSALRTPGNGQSNGRSPAASPLPDTAKSTQRRRFHSWGGPGLLPGLGLRGRDARMSSESAIASESSSAGAHHAFEVVNRPQRTRHVSTSGTIALSEVSHRMTPRNLSDLSWLERRRSVNAVGELDYALSQQLNGRTVPPTPGTAEVLSTHALMADARKHSASHPQAQLPPLAEILLHTLFHAALLATIILALIALWNRAPKATFAVFLVWTVAFYAALLLLAALGRPRDAALTVLLARLRGGAAPAASPSPSRPLSTTGTEQFPFPGDARGPYLNTPAYRAAHEDDRCSASHAGPLSVETDEPESDEDEETRQRRIEEEMGRREVSIVTVPKRKLWVVNPS